MSATTLLQRLPRASSSRVLSSCSTRSFTSSSPSSFPSSSIPPPPTPLNSSRLAPTSNPDLRASTRKVPKYYPWSIDPTKPVGDLFSADGVKMVAVDYHQALLSRLAGNTQGTELESASVLQIVEKTAQDAIPDLEPVRRNESDAYWRVRRRKTFYAACDLLNNNFFLSTLRNPDTPGSYPYQLEKQVIASFGSSTGLEQTLLGTAEGMSTSGWIWLVQEERNSLDGLSLIATSGPGTLLVHKARPVAPLPNLGLTVPDGYIYGEQHHAKAVSSLLAEDVESRASLLNETSGLLPALPFSNPYAPTTVTNASPAPSFGELTSFRRIIPLAVLSMNESAWMVDHGVWGKEEYVKAWLRAVDWELVEKRMFYTGGQEGKQIIDTTVGREWNQ